MKKLLLVAVLSALAIPVLAVESGSVVFTQRAGYKTIEGLSRQEVACTDLQWLPANQAQKRLADSLPPDFSAEANFMKREGYARWRVRIRDGIWIPRNEAIAILLKPECLDK